MAGASGTVVGLPLVGEGDLETDNDRLLVTEGFFLLLLAALCVFLSSSTKLAGTGSLGLRLTFVPAVDSLTGETDRLLSPEETIFSVLIAGDLIGEDLTDDATRSTVVSMPADFFRMIS